MTGKAEAQVVVFIVGGEVPRLFGGVIGNRRLKQIIFPADDGSHAIGSGSDDICQFFGMAKAFISLGVQAVFTLKNFGIAGVYLIVPVQLPL